MKKESSRLTAVIELGTTSVRMVVGQMTGKSEVSIVDELEQAVSLGNDTLISGSISTETIERCVSALATFRKILKEYAVEEERVRVIATSAVREASNRNRFCDRILLATGFNVEVIDRPEVSRLTYQAIHPQLKKLPNFKSSNVMVIEVGGGSTEAMFFSKGKVNTSHLYKLGSLRLRGQMDNEDILPEEQMGFVQAEMAQMLSTMRTQLPKAKKNQLLLLGAEARFACSHINATVESGSGLLRIKLNDLKKLTGSIVNRTVDELVKKYDLTYTEAETLSPSLLIAENLAEQFDLKSLYVSDVSLRTGVLMENIKGEQWTEDYRKQVINSAEVCAATHYVDISHARNVAGFGTAIINALKHKYEFSAREQVIFQAAALLHEAGQHINTSSHHKHSLYIIMNSDIFGIGGKDLVQTALIARYHRRALPKPTHKEYMDLKQKERITVSKLAAVLRVANALDRLHSSKRQKITAAIEGPDLVIVLGSGPQIELIRKRVTERADLFKEIYGLNIALRGKE